MKRGKTINPMTALCFAAIAFSLLAGGCSAKGAARADYRYGGGASLEAAYSQNAAQAEESVPEWKEDNEYKAAGETAALPEERVPETAPGGPRKLVRQAAISIRVQEPEKADAALSALMTQYGAYASSVNIWENSRHYTIRVPEASYTTLLSALDGMGRLLHRSESAEDVTLRYYDLEGRLSTKRELLKTFQSYLGRAKNIEEILSVEERIAELEDDIDGTGKELRSLGSLVDYATVELEIQGPETVPSYAAPTLGERISGLFGSLREFFSTLLVILLGIIVYGIPGLLILALLFLLLFGRIGLVKKLWRLAAGKKDAALKAENKKGDHPGESTTSP
jgi:TfoX/Sxy family transcriptional regulator of competence genes